MKISDKSRMGGLFRTGSRYTVFSIWDSGESVSVFVLSIGDFVSETTAERNDCWVLFARRINSIHTWGGKGPNLTETGCRFVPY